MTFRTSEYSLSYQFSRDWGSPFSCTTVSLGFDTPTKWITLSFDCVTEPQEKPSSRIGSLLWRFKGKLRYEFIRSVTVVDAADSCRPQQKSADTNIP